MPIPEKHPAGSEARTCGLLIANPTFYQLSYPISIRNPGGRLRTRQPTKLFCRYLSSNLLQYLPHAITSPANLKAIQVLALDRNKITFIQRNDFTHHTSLTTLSLEYNLVVVSLCMQFMLLGQAWPNQPNFQPSHALYTITRLWQKELFHSRTRLPLHHCPLMKTTPDETRFGELLEGADLSCTPGLQALKPASV